MQGKKIAIVIHTIGNPMGRIFPSIRSCAQAYDLQSSHISECLSGKRQQHKGYTFEPLYCGYYEEQKKKEARNEI